jgi:hypothetical protein
VGREAQQPVVLKSTGFGLERSSASTVDEEHFPVVLKVNHGERVHGSSNLTENKKPRTHAHSEGV